jgi:NADPH-dependent 2,4-dienoyl-CoA reductase/sulfur reductase-like enzyme
MAAALEIRSQGLSCVILEREESLGGILLQCVHNGFGLIEFNEELSGPEFAERLEERIRASGRRFTSGSRSWTSKPRETAGSCTAIPPDTEYSA